MLLAATLTQKLPGSRISCRSTRPITMDESSSSAQVTSSFIPLFFPFPFNPWLLFLPEGSFLSTLLLSLQQYPLFFWSFSHPIYFLFLCSYKVSVIFALVHPSFYCCSTLLVPWLLAVFLSCPSLLLLLCYDLTVYGCQAPLNSSKPLKVNSHLFSANFLRSSCANHHHERFNFSLTKNIIKYL